MSADGSHPGRAPHGVDRARWPYRMKDLCERTGLPRQVIHFYIAQGLLPEGRKTGRNMAYYGEEHVERVRLIRRLQHERFLPLKAIRAMLEERDDAFSPAQRRLLAEVKARLGADLGLRADSAPSSVDAEELLARVGLSRRDLDAMADAGVVGTTEDAQGRTLVSRDDVWMFELFAQMRRAGFDEDLGFTGADLALYDEAISALFKREAELLTRRLAHLPAERVAAMVERSLPLINTFLARYHTARVRNFFATL